MRHTLNLAVRSRVRPLLAPRRQAIQSPAMHRLMYHRRDTAPCHMDLIGVPFERQVPFKRHILNCMAKYNLGSRRTVDLPRAVLHLIMLNLFIHDWAQVVSLFRTLRRLLSSLLLHPGIILPLVVVVS